MAHLKRKTCFFDLSKPTSRLEWTMQCKKLVAERVRESVWNWMKRDRYIVKINAGMCAFESEVCSLN